MSTPIALPVLPSFCAGDENVEAGAAPEVNDGFSLPEARTVSTYMGALGGSLTEKDLGGKGGGASDLSQLGQGQRIPATQAQVRIVRDGVQFNRACS